ncbi:hypothetical protein PCE1_003345 [Barthelona sp. PCE]
MSSDYDCTYKVLILGEAACGKSSVLERYVHNSFNHNTQSTIGVAYYSKIVELGEKRVCLNCFDSAGQERFRSLNASLFHGAAAVLLVYDITSEESYNSLDYWISEVHNHCGDEILLMFCGNKVDLSPQKRSVPQRDGIEIAEKHQALFFETSALNGENVIQAFTELLRVLLERNADFEEEVEETVSFDMHSNSLIPLDDFEEEAPGCSC